jgi:phosphoglycerate-specific signal transduction histidine kinase
MATFPITEILNAARDAVKIVYRLREFSRPGQTHILHLPVNVNDLIQQATFTLRFPVPSYPSFPCLTPISG